MNKIMLDAFKALDNIDDELVTPVKKAVNKDKRINESKVSGNAKKAIKEEAEEEYVYQFFPLTKEDKSMLKKYNLEFLGRQGKGGFQPGDSIVKGTLENLKKYCKEWLGYEMHPDYLCKEGDFCKDFLESCDSINEAPITDLSANYDNRKSFYGKARVDVKDNGTKVLYSYGTPVCRIEKGKATLLNKGHLGWSSSQTTLRHVKEFLKQNGFEVASLRELAKMYPIEQARADESLKEEVVDLSKEDKVKKAKKVLKDDKAERQETIVDVDAETIDELKDSYVGNAILRCPVCRTLIYKKPDDLKQDGDNEIYNVDEECPHCHSQDGFELVGQVAELTKDEAEAEVETTTGKENDAESEVETSEEEPKRTTRIDTEESLKKEFVVEDIDETRFDKLINQYLVSTYNNVEGYATTNGKVDNDNNILVLEGKIKYKSGKEKATSFVFEAKSSTKGGRIRFAGINETFTKSRNAFSLYGRISKDGCLRCESMRYSYGVKVLDESKLVKGKVEIKEKKSK